MKNRNFALLVGGLAMMFLASSAQAAFTTCGTVSSPLGQTQFDQQPVTLTCSGFTIPPLYTLTSIDFRVYDDATFQGNPSSAVTWTWTYVGNGLGAFTATGSGTETASSGVGFNTCGAGVGALNCVQILNVSSGWTIVSGVLQPISFSVSANPTGTGTNPGVYPGDGVHVDTGGSTNALLQIQLNETAPAPEPASLVMVGAGLLGLGFFARKRRKA
jgi:hypothetical protein